jgi:hypothetical protein
MQRSQRLQALPAPLPQAELAGNMAATVGFLDEDLAIWAGFDCFRVV